MVPSILRTHCQQTLQLSKSKDAVRVGGHRLISAKRSLILLKIDYRELQFQIFNNVSPFWQNFVDVGASFKVCAQLINQVITFQLLVLLIRMKKLFCYYWCIAVTLNNNSFTTFTFFKIWFISVRQHSSRFSILLLRVLVRRTDAHRKHSERPVGIPHSSLR